MVVFNIIVIVFNILVDNFTCNLYVRLGKHVGPLTPCNFSLSLSDDLWDIDLVQ